MVNKVWTDRIPQRVEHDRVEADNEEEGEEVAQDKEASLK